MTTRQLSETGKTHENILMCLPVYFQIEYEINPWMNIKNQVNKFSALKQWRDLYKIYSERLGRKINLVSAQKGIPEMTFLGDSVFIYKNKVISSNFVYRKRQKEEEYITNWFSKRNYRIKRLPENIFFEGSADAFVWNNKILGGWGVRSDKEAYSIISNFFGIEVAALELIDPKFYHLDTALFPINQNLIAYYPAAFARESRDKIENLGAEVIRVNHDEAYRFVCNSISVKNIIVMPKRCPHFKKDVESKGYKTIEVDISEFAKAGGGIKCLTLKF